MHIERDAGLLQDAQAGVLVHTHGARTLQAQRARRIDLICAVPPPDADVVIIGSADFERGWLS
jgi:hypothetical protein